MYDQQRNEYRTRAGLSGAVRFRTRYLPGRGIFGGTSRKPAGISNSVELTGAAEKLEFSIVISMREESPEELGDGAGAASCAGADCFLRPKPPRPPKRPERALAIAADGFCCELFCVVL